MLMIAVGFTITYLGAGYIASALTSTQSFPVVIVVGGGTWILGAMLITRGLFFPSGPVAAQKHEACLSSLARRIYARCPLTDDSGVAR